jgi:hypothetical protein
MRVETHEIGSGLCPIVSFDISGIKPLDSLPESWSVVFQHPVPLANHSIRRGSLGCVTSCHVRRPMLRCHALQLFVLQHASTL